MVDRRLVKTRSQAESYIKLGQVTVVGEAVTKPGYFVSDNQEIRLTAEMQYVSRAALKLAGAAEKLGLKFTGKAVLDVGSSTGGFTDYALKHGANKVLAVDVGTGQLHPDLRSNPRVVLREKTDIRSIKELPVNPDIVLIDVSFISLRDVLPHIAKLVDESTQIVAMVKPQFEAGKQQATKGVIKNDSVRRGILKGFEGWAKSLFVIVDKADSNVAGSRGNLERFYLLKRLK
jgi:23S rRNA (cytidine1920-2'-O)/16S rRNA (cytidine1409-2'-O)-methyltransferase